MVSDSILSTSIVPVNASGTLSQTDDSSGGATSGRPVLQPEPKVRLAASAAGDDNQTQKNPGARPVVTKGQPKSPTRVSDGQFVHHPHQQSSGHYDAAQSTSKGRPADDTANEPSDSSSDSFGVGSDYDELANSGPNALAQDAGTLAQFVQDRLANLTSTKWQAFKSQLQSKFAKYLDDLFTTPASAEQPGSQQTVATAQPADSPSSTDLENENCFRLREMHEQILADLFFLEAAIGRAFRRYKDVKGMIVMQCH